MKKVIQWLTGSGKQELPNKQPFQPANHEEWIRHGQAAAELLANPLFHEAMTAVRNDLNAQLMTVRLDDVNVHTRLIMAMQVTRAVERHLVSIVETGQAAAGELNLRGMRID